MGKREKVRLKERNGGEKESERGRNEETDRQTEREREREVGANEICAICITRKYNLLFDG